MKETVLATPFDSQTATIQTSKLIRNTYMLLSMTLLFSGMTAGVGRL